MRAVLRPFVLHAAYTPIETIVFFCIIGTLAYFHILNAIKHSAFLSPGYYYYYPHHAGGQLSAGGPLPPPLPPSTLRPAYVLHRDGEWVGVREGRWLKERQKQLSSANIKEELDGVVPVEVQQVIFSLDGYAWGLRGRDFSSDLFQPSLSSPLLLASTNNLTQFLTHGFNSKPASGLDKSYGTICYRPSSPLSKGNSCFTTTFNPTTSAHHPQIQMQQLLTLGFAPGSRDGWVHALKGEGEFVDETGVRFDVVASGNGAYGYGSGYGGYAVEDMDIGQMRSGKWVAYAMRALVLRFWDLAKKADSLDILLILAGYILMHITFYLLLTRSRRLGSSFWLPLAILSSAILALLLALPIAMALKIPIDPVALTEALPFLVCTVGFDKPLRLARAVFLHEHLVVPPSAGSQPSLAAHGTSADLKPAPKIITESLTLVYPPIMRDYFLEIAVLVVGANSKVGGLREVCALAALVLGVDCLLLCTYLAAVLGVMIEVRRIKTVRALTRSRSNSFSSSHKSNSSTNLVSLSRSHSSHNLTNKPSAMARPAHPIHPPTLRHRISSALLGGEKGSSLPEYARGLGIRVKSKALSESKGKGEEVKEENPVARLKLLLIASFMTLHILNFITPLTPSRHVYSGSSLAHASSSRKVDVTTPGVRAVLDAIVDAEGLGTTESLEQNGNNSNNNNEDDEFSLGLDSTHNHKHREKQILLKISPPVYIRVSPPLGLGLSSRLSPSSSPSSHSSHSTMPSLNTNNNHLGYGVHSPRKRRTTSELLESFMSSWTRLVGDPILSKWIVVVLAISISLNGYLLRGIAAGVGVGGVGALLVGRGKGGVRFEDGDGEAEAEISVVPQPRVVGSSGSTSATVIAAAGSQVDLREQQQAIQQQQPRRERQSLFTPTTDGSTIGTFTLEDVDRKLKAQRRLTITSRSAVPASASASLVSVTSTSGASGSVPTPPSSSSDTSSDETDDPSLLPVRSLAECINIFDNGPRPLSKSLALLNDEEVILLAQNGKIAAYALEKVLGGGTLDLERAVRIRRALISRASLTQTLESAEIPLESYDYARVLGACCENVVGYIPLPLGIAGPLNVDGTLYPIPMATAEGTLVASTSRGCKALNAGGGVTTVLLQDGMTRGPAIDFPSVIMAADAKAWIASDSGYGIMKEAFESTSRFARLTSMKTALAGRTLFVRFKTATGDAMGMNMISKGTEKALEVMQTFFPEMVVLALSGNYCTDKKPAAINWIEGRGKSVVAEAVVPGKVVRGVLKTTVEALCNLNVKKNLVGSAMAGSVGGFNAHAANILTAVFLATGQDPAQNVESSNCMTLMEPVNNNEDLLITITMPSIEVGTVGGGTVLAPQQAVLEMLGVKGAHPTHPGQNAQRLARVIAAAVMAGELSLLSALAAGHLIRAHMAHNRSRAGTPACSVPGTPGGSLVEVKAAVLVAEEKKVETKLELEVKTEKNGTSEKGVELGPLTPSSMGSLPPYSR